jgi:hypothetical protein
LWEVFFQLSVQQQNVLLPRLLPGRALWKEDVMGMDRKTGCLHYMAAVAFLEEMLRRELIDEADYCALETKYAGIFLPLFRYEKPCKNATLPITQTGKEGRGFDGTNH